jgi:hypothetical protein
VTAFVAASKRNANLVARNRPRKTGARCVAITSVYVRLVNTKRKALVILFGYRVHRMQEERDAKAYPGTHPMCPLCRVSKPPADQSFRHAHHNDATTPRQRRMSAPSCSYVRSQAISATSFHFVCALKGSWWERVRECVVWACMEGVMDGGKERGGEGGGKGRNEWRK